MWASLQTFPQYRNLIIIKQLSAHVEHSKTQEMLLAIQTRDNAELREMLQLLSHDIAELRNAAEQNFEDVPRLMQSVQEVCPQQSC